MTDRIALAKDLFVAYMKAGKPIQIETSFLLADDFLLQDSKQREPKACEHRWVTVGGGVTHCILCGAPYSKPEPPKPKRVARMVWVCFNSDGMPMYAWGTQDREGTRKLFREVLPEDGK